MCPLSKSLSDPLHVKSTERRAPEINTYFQKEKPALNLVLCSFVNSFFFFSVFLGQPRNLQDLCRIKIRQCIGLQNLKLLDELPIAKVMKDYLKHKFDDI